MRKYHFVCLYLLATSTFCFGQRHLNSTYTGFVFVDSTNVRDVPSITGKILGKVNHNTSIVECASSDVIEGKVGGITDYWQPIIFEGVNGYIWIPNLADGFFKSELDPEVHFLINFTAYKGLEFKVFRNNTLSSSQFFEYKNYKGINGSTSFGTTFNSNGKEIIAVALDTIYELFEWDGKIIKSSEIKLSDDSFITGKYFPYEAALINSNKVNVRSKPDKSALVLETLDAFTNVEWLKKKPIFDTLNEKPGCWYSIKRNGKLGYVWSDFIDIPQRFVKSNKLKEESFLYTNNAIYVFDQSKVKYRLPIDLYYYHDGTEEDEMYKKDFIQFGNKGLSLNYQFLGICYSANACGEAGGDNLYLWDGNKMVHFANDFSVGDGAYSESHNYLFPNEFGGMKNKVIHETGYEYFGVEASNCSESNAMVFTYSRYELKFNGDTLVETESIDSRLRAFLTDSLPTYELNHATFSDLNHDGVSDAVFLMVEKREEDQYDILPKPLVGVAYGTSAGEFQSLRMNQNLVLERFFTVEFKAKNDTLEMRVYYNLDDYPDETGIPAYSQFTFIHDPNYNKLVWYAKIEAEEADPESRELSWKITNSEKFRKNKVSFTNAWENRKFE